MSDSEENQTGPLPPKEPADGKCNARERLNGVNAYCNSPGRLEGKRCERHDLPYIRDVYRRSQMSPDDLKWLMVKELESRIEELGKDPSNTLSLDREILQLTALIEILRTTNPVGEAETIRRLTDTKAGLIWKKVEIEYKNRVILNPESIWEKVKGILDTECKDETTRAALKVAFLKMLDEIAEVQKK